MALQTIASALVCLQRLEKQQEFLCKRGSDMLCQGLKTLDKLDTVEEREEREQEMKDKQVAPDTKRQLASTTNVFSLFSPKELLAFEAPPWALLGSGGEMPPTSQSS